MFQALCLASYRLIDQAEKATAICWEKKQTLTKANITPWFELFNSLVTKNKINPEFMFNIANIPVDNQSYT